MKKKTRIKKLDVYIIITLVLIVAFIVTMCYFFTQYGFIPDTLVQCVLGTGAGELIISALIKIMGDKHDSRNNDFNNINNNDYTDNCG